MSNSGRLSIWQAAYVVARRDFMAILWSRAFFFFLLGPLFPVIVGALAGTIGSKVQQQAQAPEIGVAMAPEDAARMLAARQALAPMIGPSLPQMTAIAPPDARRQPAQMLKSQASLAAVVSGTPAAPVLTATRERLEWWEGPIALIAAQAAGQLQADYPQVALDKVATSAAQKRGGQTATAQAGQLLLFLLIMMLAGMVLSNLVEEKGNKVIEVLAAAIPMDAVFLGKLFAMLGISLVGITVWGSIGTGVVLIAGSSGPAAEFLGGLPAPGVGWPLFFGFGVVYFSMGYLLLGAIFLAIGSMAATVREVQTLSMPVTMGQLLVFFLAQAALTAPGGWMERAAMAFPLSSPFTMLARAAQDDALWPHALAIGWQMLCVAIFIKAGAALFRKRVMKSGPQTARKKRRKLRDILAGASAPTKVHKGAQRQQEGI